MRDLPILNLRDIQLSFGTRVLFRSVTLDINRFDKITLVGHNGSGKSTLLKVMGEVIPPDAGERYVEPGINIAFVQQDPQFDPTHVTVEDHLHSVQGDASQFYKAEMYAAALGVRMDHELAVLSGGERRRVALVAAFMQEPDLLLMDEPTNHLDLASIQWLEDTLKSFRGAFVVISHDRTFLKNITTTVLWLDRGTVRRLDKGFEHFEAWQEALIEDEVKQTQRLGKLLEKEQSWLHRGVTGRRKRNQGRLRRLIDLRHTRATMLNQSRTANWELPKEISASKVVIEAFGISKSYGQRTLIKDFSTRILHGDRIGIIGPNGTGKSTLLKMLTGLLPPDTGVAKFGKKMEVVYLDQHRTSLNPEKSLKETLCPGGGDHVGLAEKSKHVVAYLKDFMFLPEQAESKVSTLSGGERNRLLLAKSLSLPSSLMVLDEPTNDLDMDTLDMLQDLLDSYPGTLLIVSHDRDFLDQTVTSIIAFDTNGALIEYAGGYSDYMQQLAQRVSSPKSASAPSKRPPPPEPLSPPPSKLSYKHTFRLSKIPQELETMSLRRAELEHDLHDPTLYTRDAPLFDSLSAELHAIIAKKDALETEWLELEALREELEG